jgi:transcriptional regulator NrdR family protein
MMRCRCGGSFDDVSDSRPTQEGPDGPTIRRRRKCDSCDERTTTYEVRADFLARFKAQLAKDMATKLINDFL